MLLRESGRGSKEVGEDEAPHGRQKDMIFELRLQWLVLKRQGFGQTIDFQETHQQPQAPNDHTSIALRLEAIVCLSVARCIDPTQAVEGRGARGHAEVGLPAPRSLEMGLDVMDLWPLM